MCRWVMNSMQGQCRSRAMAHAMTLLYTYAGVAKIRALGGLHYCISGRQAGRGAGNSICFG